MILVSLGPERALADDRWRHGIELLAVGVLAVVAIAVGGVTLRGGGPTMDERDRAILERAPRAQVAAVLVTLMAWVVYLTERFSASGQVPVVFLSLIAWSCLLVAMLGIGLRPMLVDVWTGIFPFFAEPDGYDMSSMFTPELRAQMVGAWGLLALIFVESLFNTFLGEEFLFRGVLLPKMEGVFGKWDWVANGVIFGF